MRDRAASSHQTTWKVFAGSLGKTVVASMVVPSGPGDLAGDDIVLAVGLDQRSFGCYRGRTDRRR